MSGTNGTTTADRQRMRSARGTGGKGPANRMPAPPRQRRPALAAIAVLLIVGGALVAGLIAIRMDSRVEVIAASDSLQPGQKITADDLTPVQIASDSRVKLIGWKYRDKIVGSYAKGTIYKGMLLDVQMLDSKSPVGEGRAIVSVQLNPDLTPSQLAKGDLVQVVRASDNAATGSAAKDLTQGLVLSVSKAKKDSLGGPGSGSVSLMVPESSAKEVIDASHAQLAGLALLKRGQSVDAIPGS
jgi:membrane-associated protease RseP (regulator of RpoE activity)